MIYRERETGFSTRGSASIQLENIQIFINLLRAEDYLRLYSITKVSKYCETIRIGLLQDEDDVKISIKILYKE